MKNSSFFLGIMMAVGATSQASSLVYTPENFKPKSARVMVVLHGCMQTPEEMALGTGWDQVAEKENLVVIYPRVPEGSNVMNCWGWFDSENLNAESGQLYDIQQEIRRWKKTLKIPHAPVYAAGISAGAATVAGLLSCFPDEFAGGAIHSGPAYGLADSLASGTRVLKAGPLGVSRVGTCDPSQFQKPVIILQGSLDFVVNPVNVQRLAQDFFSESQYSLPINGRENSLIFTTVDYSKNDQLTGRVVYVYGLGHAWSGSESARDASPSGVLGTFQKDLQFFSDRGPNATQMIMNFFNETRR